MPMNVLTPRTLAAAAMSALTLAAIAAPAGAATVTDTFEPGSPPSGYTRSFGATSGAEARLSNPGEPAIDTQSAIINLNDSHTSFARVSLGSATPYGKLRDVITSFQANVSSTSTPGVAIAPFVQLNLDINGNGIYDPSVDTQVLSFSSQAASPPPTNTFFTDGFNSTQFATVSGDRGELGTDEYKSTSSTSQTLGSLFDRVYDSSTGQLFGDFNVVRVDVGAGFTGGSGNYSVAVDNLSVTGPGVTAVPEPIAGLGMLGLLGLGVVRRGKRVE